MNDRLAVIAELSSDLERVKPVVHVDRVACVWFALSALAVIAVTHLVGPIRSNALVQLGTEPRFLAETLLGGAALLLATLTAFRAAVPGALSPRFAALGAGAMLLWIGSHLFGLVSPALEPSMLGKRPHCVIEVLIYGLPPILAALMLTRRWYSLQPVRTTFWFSIAAAMMPALYMQIACMYAPEHILKFHIMPALLVAALASAAAWVLCKVRFRAPPIPG